MVRSSRDFETFQGQGAVASSYAAIPMSDGAAAQAAARTFAGMAATLGRLADKAAARDATMRGEADAAKAIGLPETKITKDSKAPAAASGKASERALRAKQFFMGQGWSEAQAAGIVGNLMAESGLETKAYNPNDPGGSVGLGQWNRERRAGLYRFAASRGTAAVDLDTQLAYVQHELMNGEAGAGRALKAATNVDEATAAMIGYERPAGWSANNPRGGHNWVGRLRHAQGLIGGTYKTSTFVPEPKPLALRRDGTIAGDAYDRSVQETASWRMQGGLEAELTQAARDFEDDPVGWAKARKEIGDKYVGQARAVDPQLGLAIEQRVFERSATYDSHIMAKAEAKADADRKDAAGAALAASTEGLDRQAYLIGAAKDGDERLAAISGQAMAAIDAAVASGAVSEVEAARQREGVTRSLVESRVTGVFDALPDGAAKLAFVEGLDEEYANDKSPLAKLDPGTFQSLQARLKGQAVEGRTRLDAAARMDKAKFKGLVADDLASLKGSGQGVKVGDQPLDPLEVARVLGPEAATKWLADRAEALNTHNAVSGLEKLPQEAIDERLGALEPKPGESDYSAKERVLKAAEKRAKEIDKQRREDPAQAAHEAFPELDELAKDPAKAIDLVQARLHAQEALGVGEMAREPLTATEAKKLADRLLMAEDMGGDNVKPVMQGLARDVRQTYGDYADEVLAQVLHAKGIDKTTAAIGAEVIGKLGIGAIVSPEIQRTFGTSQATDHADKAVAGEAVTAPKVRTPMVGDKGFTGRYGNNVQPQKKSAVAGRAVAPTQATVQRLLDNPELAPQFDEMFGNGAAQEFLDTADDAKRTVPYVTTKLPDGSYETRWPNGRLIISYPDGHVEIKNGAGERP